MNNRKEIKRPWWYNSLRGMSYYAFRYWALFLIAFFLLLAVWAWFCYLPYLNREKQCCDCQLQYIHDSIPRAPQENCRVHFSGLLMGGHYDEVGISEIYKEDFASEYVGAGYYPNNAQAFPKAVNATFDGIAIDRGTRLILYSQPDFQGNVLLDVKGPAIINNVIWIDDPRYNHCNSDNYSRNLQSNYPQNVRRWSSSNMQEWSKGSCKIMCSD